MARRRKSLGDPAKKHAARAVGAVNSAEAHTRHASHGSCGIRFTSLVAAHQSLGKAFAQAFGSGGKVASGALTPKTVTTEVAKRIYDADEKLTQVTQQFRSDCLKPNGGR